MNNGFVKRGELFAMDCRMDLHQTEDEDMLLCFHVTETMCIMKGKENWRIKAKTDGKGNETPDMAGTILQI